MKIDREKCTDCQLCITACPLKSISYQDEHVELSRELCVNEPACSAAEICPVDAIERVERAEDAVVCTNRGCPILCEIRPDKMGECRMIKNVDGKIVSTVPPVPFESVKETVGPDFDEVIRQPLLTGIGFGLRGMAGDPLIVQDKVNGVDVVTCVSECHFTMSGLRLLINTERFVGEEGAEVYRNNIRVGRVTADGYGVKTMDVGGVNTFTGKNGWLAAKTVVDIANRERVELRVKGGSELEVQVGEKPVVNGEVMERRRWGCGGDTAAALLGTFVAGLVDEVIAPDRGFTGHDGVREDLGLGMFLNPMKSSIRLRFQRPTGWSFPHQAGPGWGMTPLESPLDIIESFDPKKLTPGYTLLISECSADRVGYFVFSEDGEFVETEMPRQLREAVEEFRANCEPSNVTAYYRAGAGGTARRSLVKEGRPMKLSEALRNRKARLTVAGAPAEVFPGGGIDFMVDVQKVKAGSFGWTQAPTTIAPLEWTLKLQDFVDIGGLVEVVRPLKGVLDFIDRGVPAAMGPPIWQVMEEATKAKAR